MKSKGYLKTKFSIQSFIDEVQFPPIIVFLESYVKI